ncbi:EscU/YscU/HrcU family type III secretion system export apparatus switch protein [Glaciecola sp. XM2]|jgi:flagellar biosynthesis protein|uniref:EscU/YscU/HrcU family type III secretion system export apparatus switch protein n=1 Tax=Glaciecola sp. XM2 TaxID=1914931 RepID=UPI001BDE6C21|nr:EscU/YscU/HrcU family type III secretion system export apparatus switch protein [Glaciecola sp. XM2]MBT1450677.1 EscU/YscU/HrcU family type III secretion system export apparatus switch protein [Glaciecola sp. XM2]
MTYTKPSPKAVALKYDSLSPKQAPKVVATGTGTLAEEIIALAQQHGIFIHQDAHLSEILSQLDLGQEIPETLYHVIAELIAFSFVMQGQFPDTWNNMHQRIDFKE